MKWVANLLCASVAVLMSATLCVAQCVPCGGCSDPCARSSVAVASGCAGAYVAAGCGGSVVTSAPMTVLEAGPYVTGPAISGCSTGAVTGPAISVQSAPAPQVVCNPINSFKVVMEPRYETVSQAEVVTRTRTETRYRTKTVYRSVPIVETKYRQKMVNVPKSDTKTIKYSELVAKTSTKTVDVVDTVPVWNEVPETYTVKVPTLTDVPEEYTVKVPKLQDEQFTYTVMVPQAVTEQKVHTVINAVPVVKTREIQVQVPTFKKQTVTKDFGHWEEQVVAAPVAQAAPVATVSYGAGCGGYSGYGATSSGCGVVSGCGGCAPCGGCNPCGCAPSNGCGGAVVSSGCGGTTAYAACGAPVVAMAPAAPATMTKRVWVPNVRTEEIEVPSSETRTEVLTYTVYEQQATKVPYECTRLVYQPEERTGTKQTVVYVDEPRTRMRKVVQYNEESRTRIRKELTYKKLKRTETIPVVSYTTEERTKEVTYTYNEPSYIQEPYQVTRYDRVAEEQIEEYTVTVPYTTTEERKVQVAKMVPRLVPIVINPCASAVSAGATYSAELSGGSVMESAPVMTAPVQSGGTIMGGGCGGCGVPAAVVAPCGGCGAPVGSPCGC